MKTSKYPAKQPAGHLVLALFILMVALGALAGWLTPVAGNTGQGVVSDNTDQPQPAVTATDPNQATTPEPADQATISNQARTSQPEPDQAAPAESDSQTDPETVSVSSQPADNVSRNQARVTDLPPPLPPAASDDDDFVLPPPLPDSAYKRITVTSISNTRSSTSTSSSTRTTKTTSQSRPATSPARTSRAPVISGPIKPDSKYPTRAVAERNCGLVYNYSGWSDADMAFAVCMAESYGRIRLINYNDSWKFANCRGSYGLFQVGCFWVKKPNNLLNADYNIRTALRIHKQQGWQPWSVYHNKRYLPFLPD